MRIMRKKIASGLSMPTLRLEGSLFLPDKLEKAALGKASHQAETDYRIPKGLKLKDEYSRAFQIASAQWKHFAAQKERQDLDSFSITQRFVVELLQDALGYQLTESHSVTLGERVYPVTYMAAHNVPVVIAPHTLDLDDVDERFAIVGSGVRKKSAFQLAQEFLNASADHLWALVSNGKQIRLLRDSDTLTRPSYIEFDIQDMLSALRFAEFESCWRLLHASRANGGEAGESFWEAWRNEGKSEGTRVREGLREGVTQALLTLGEGYLQHPANEALRLALLDGKLTKEEYFQQVLRLVYRLIFIFTVEERGLLHPEDDSTAAIAARRAYAQGYALARWRERCLKRRARNRFDDIWTGIKIVFRGLVNGEPRLALPPLGGLYAQDQCPDLDAAALSNAAILEAISQLRWSRWSGNLAPVDYRNMGSEELGSVYEGLLDLKPDIDLMAKSFNFVSLKAGGGKGTDRKTSGSYYTPDELVQELIKSASEPVIEARLAENPADPINALLNIKVCDPACGSGHFLLAAARRLAEHLAVLRAQDGAVKSNDYRQALRDVVKHCIYGVDRNPMALELAKVAIWIEAMDSKNPLSFLDHHLIVGDALLGITDFKQLTYGIPDAAFKALSGDDKSICKELSKNNKDAKKAFTKHKLDSNYQLALTSNNILGLLTQIESMDDGIKAEQIKANLYTDFIREVQNSRLAQAADMLIAAFLAAKNSDTQLGVPTSQNVYLALFTDQSPDDQPQAHQRLRLNDARDLCKASFVLHWPLVFPQVFAQGGFDCVLGNPPWERIKLQEEEYFASSHPLIAQAMNKSERGQRIQWLSEGMLAKHIYPELEHPKVESEQEKRLYAKFIIAKRVAEAASMFAHVKGEEGGRYPLTGIGDVNTYALFSETIRQVLSPKGRAGFIVPSGLATDNSTKDFFGELITKKSLESFFEFENEGFFMGAGQGHMLRFALTTMVGSEQQVAETRFLFQGKKLNYLNDERRVFTLTPEDIFRVNPNTLTCPIFQSRYDAELTKKIYQRVPVLIREATEKEPEVNPWGIRFTAMYHMSNDSHLFKTHDDIKVGDYQADGNHFVGNGEYLLPLYESKMIQIYTHRHGDFADAGGQRAHILPTVPAARLADTSYLPQPYYWVDKVETYNRLKELGWDKKWLLCWRNVTDSRASARTLISSLIPLAGVGNSLPVILPLKKMDNKFHAAFLANISTLILDYFVRTKVAGLNLNFFILKQFPVLSPDKYSEDDLIFITPRVLRLTYTAYDLKNWAEDLGYNGEPFTFDPDSRAILRSELDAYYAKLYGLTRDELRYILDPADVMGADYPSETFAVLKRSEIKEFGEYRTQRLVLEAWDKLESGQLS